MARLKTQERLVRSIPQSVAEQARLQREFTKYKGMQAGLEQRSNNIARLESILHQIAQYRETAQEAQLASAMPQMMERFNMPDVRTIERDMNTMQRLVADSQEVSSVVSDGLAMSAMTLSGPDAMQISDPQLLEDELSQFLAEAPATPQQQQHRLHASAIDDSHSACAYNPAAQLSALPRVPKQSSSTSNTALSTALQDIGW